jgi:hypothetical protein
VGFSGEAKEVSEYTRFIQNQIRVLTRAFREIRGEKSGYRLPISPKIDVLKTSFYLLSLTTGQIALINVHYGAT